jgi:coenzyme PQQ biosynthesis protein PqqD
MALTSVTLGSKPRLAKKAVPKWDRFEARTILLYPERGLALSEVAAAIVARLDGERTVATIAAEIAAAFPGAPAEEVERDVMEFLGELEARGLLEGIA